MRPLPARRLPAPCAQSAAVAVLSLLTFSGAARAVQITGYTPEQHDRFEAGFPAAPVPNGNASFVGAGRDWSGAGWSAADGTKGFVFLSPRHYLAARHYGGASQIRVLDQDGALRTAAEAGVVETGYGLITDNGAVGDLSLGTTAAPVSRIARYGVLDLNSSSTANNATAYTNTGVFLYGRGASGAFSPRVALTAVSSVTASGNNTFCSTPRTAAQLEGGDSGSPIFADWTNPNGAPELAVLGNHAAVNETNNFHSFLGVFQVINRLNELMTAEGRALRVVGTPSNTWAGVTSTNITSRQAWGLPVFQSAPSDRFALFNGTTAGSGRVVTVDASHNLRGLYFTGNGAAADAFTFNGTATLTIGRGGVTNYDNDRQVFNAPLALGDHQFWDAGAGGVFVTNLNTNGRLLEIRAGPRSVIAGNLSGGGSLALESGTLSLNGTSSLSGTIWAHEGELRITGSAAAVAAVRLGEGAVLSGWGRTGPVRGAGRVAPGPGGGILRAVSAWADEGLDFAFEFGGAMPVFGSAAASVNDVLRLDGAAPFGGNLTPANTVAVYLDAPGLEPGQTYRGGFFTDSAGDFFEAVSGADWRVYVRDPEGGVVYGGQSYRLYTGPLEIEAGTAAQTADFGQGPVAGRILELRVEDTYEAWAARVFPPGTPEEERQPMADPNGDGAPNFLAYAFVADPQAAEPAKMPRHTFEPGPEGGEIVFRFRRNKHAAGLVYAVEVSGDLAVWEMFAGPVVVVNPDADGDGRAELLEARVPVAAGEARKFVRLRVAR